MHNLTKLISLAMLLMSFASHSSYMSTFMDNGFLVTETRNYGTYTETWEWLDLTITNGVSYESIVSDLDDDGKLNNSVALAGHQNSILDITSLSTQNQVGWLTVNDQGVVDLINNFFGLTLIDDQSYTFNGNVSIVEDFILMFGDTYHEGQSDSNSLELDENIQLPNIGYTFGITSTVLDRYLNEAVRVSDGQWAMATSDVVTDSIDTAVLGVGSVGTGRNDFRWNAGSWLTRQAIVEVGEPGTFGLFILALTGLLMGRFRQR